MRRISKTPNHVSHAPFPAMPTSMPFGGSADPPVHGICQTQAGHAVLTNAVVPAVDSTAPAPALVLTPSPVQVQQQKAPAHPAAYRDISITHHPKFLTLVQKGNGNGYYELRCWHCGGNWSPLRKKFLDGVGGIRRHVTSCHQGQAPASGMTDRQIVESPKVRELTVMEVDDMVKRKKCAYVIPEMPLARMPVSAEGRPRGRPRKSVEKNGKSARSASATVVQKRDKAGRWSRPASETEYHPRDTDDEDQPPRSGTSMARLEAAKKYRRLK